MTTTRSTMTCKCGVILATWDQQVRQWMPPLGEAARIHDTHCPLVTASKQERRRTA